jgi:hypothetical protein
LVICIIGIAALIGCAGPTSISPKPANLQATDSEYYSMSYTYNQWFPDSFNTDFDNATNMAIANNWSTFWMGDTNDTNKRIYFTRSGDMWRPVSQAEAEQQDGTSPTTSTCPYVGTYIGMFSYEVRSQTQGREPGPGRWGEEWEPGWPPGPWSEWETDTLRLTVTFDDARSYRYQDGWHCFFTSCSCSDPYLGSFDPNITSWAILPLDPPTTPSNPSRDGQTIQLYFQHGDISTKETSGALNVSFDGRTLSNSLDPSIQNQTWDCSVVSTSSNLSDDFCGPWEGYGACWAEHNFISWSLTKSAR